MNDTKEIGYEKFIENFNSFSQKVTKELFKENKNYVFSLVSLYYALSILNEGTIGKSREELNSLVLSNVNVNRECLKEIFLNNHYVNENGKMNIASSLWIKEGFNVNKEFQKLINDYYFCEVFSSRFCNSSKEEIAKWVNHQTENFLEINKESFSFDKQTVCAIINTLYFNNKWKYEINKENIYKDLFDNQTTVEYLNHTIDTFYCNKEKYEAIFDFYHNENKIKFIMPKDGYSVEEVLCEDIFSNDGMESVKCDISFPKFEISSNYDLIKPLMNLGINNIFKNQVSNIIDGFDAKVDDIIQIAKISVNEEGTKVAAMTSIGIALTCLWHETKIFKLNKPFIYIIYDGHNIPLLVGKVKRL